jgi:hypothetical protein
MFGMVGDNMRRFVGFMELSCVLKNNKMVKKRTLEVLKYSRATSRVNWLRGEKNNISRSLQVTDQYPEDSSKRWVLISTLKTPRNVGYWSVPWKLLETLGTDQYPEDSSKRWILISTLKTPQNVGYWSVPWRLLETFGTDQYPEDENTDGPRNVGLFSRLN